MLSSVCRNWEGCEWADFCPARSPFLPPPCPRQSVFILLLCLQTAVPGGSYLGSSASLHPPACPQVAVRSWFRVGTRFSLPISMTFAPSPALRRKGFSFSRISIILISLIISSVMGFLKSNDFVTCLAGLFLLFRVRTMVFPKFRHCN